MLQSVITISFVFHWFNYPAITCFALPESSLFSICFLGLGLGLGDHHHHHPPRAWKRPLATIRTLLTDLPVLLLLITLILTILVTTTTAQVATTTRTTPQGDLGECSSLLPVFFVPRCLHCWNTLEFSETAPPLPLTTTTTTTTPPC